MSSSRAHRPALVVGLTGGIGSGKSAVAELFAELGVPIIDADVLARRAVEPDQPAFRAVVELFGAGVVGPDGALDRRRLRQRIFEDAALRERLEALLHPEIRARMEEELEGLSSAYTLLVIPLLVEAGQHALVDRVLVVDAPEEVQIERTVARDSTTHDAVERILASQVSRKERRAVADDIIDNDSTQHVLAQRVSDLHRRYLELVRCKAG